MKGDIIKNRSFERKDSEGRNVTVTFVKKGNTLFWVRVCTIIDEKHKIRADYYYEDEEFDKIVNRELGHPNIPDNVRKWVLEKGKQKK